ncbi:MAG: hypothetical protein AVDCRST_MAG53-841 [uncultured Solirubrobacteraceae bacterium]|uniref:Glycosyltransferase 2-like domain-containing protein n=1 Tax=uncultured Solirubrobacteraceae bacterium TaxID=1162706 RepID=A0A6J4S3E5_9ACTN|nr:MAG: hypothetical protein AVDCRST_MAG53-841 [uncultured Solirubrobacteraceae bacterium]
MGSAAVLVPAGPGRAERERVLDLLDALACFEPELVDVVIVDDDRRARGAWPSGVGVIANPRRGRGIGTLGGTVAGTLAGLACLHRVARGAWVLRLDADALVIGPVVARVDAAWRAGDGILGSCSQTCNGDARDVRGWSREVRRHTRPVWAWRRPPRRPWFVRPADRFVRSLLLQARATGYAPGEHCVAAGCALSAALVGALAARGWLERPERWLGARLGDDVVLGAMSRACGLRLRDCHAVFGIQHVGLADTPARLVERGFSVVHSTKNDPRMEEPAIRSFFAAARA